MHRASRCKLAKGTAFERNVFMERIVVSCMDRRLSGYLDSKYNDGKTLFMRNAGANVSDLERSIREALMEYPEIESLHVAAHTDCGAMGVVYDALTNPAHYNGYDYDIKKVLLDRFAGMAIARKDMLERINKNIQELAVSYMLPGELRVTSELIDLSALSIPESNGKHVLVISEPSNARYADMAKTVNAQIQSIYFIQGYEIKDIMPDIKIAVNVLHLNDVRLLSDGLGLSDDEISMLKGTIDLRSAQFSAVKMIRPDGN